MAKGLKNTEEDEKIVAVEVEKGSEKLSESKEKIRKIYIGPNFRNFNLRHGDIYILDKEEIPKLAETFLKKQNEKTDDLKKEISLIQKEIKENTKKEISNSDLEKNLSEKEKQLKEQEVNLKYFTSLKEMFIKIKDYSGKVGNHLKNGTIENARFNIVQEGIEKGVYN